MSDIKKYVEFDKTIGFFEDSKKYLYQTSIEDVNLGIRANEAVIDFKECCFFKLTSITYDNEYPHREALENVLSTIDNPSFNFVYIISGNLTGVDIYIGIARNYNNEIDERTYAVNYGRMLEASFKGNFQGSNLKKLNQKEISAEIIEPMYNMKRTSLITGIPSISKSEDAREADFQGIDRLINSMSGVNWRLVIVCEPITITETERIKDDIYIMYEGLHTLSKLSLQKSENISESTSKTESKSESNSKSIGTNEGYSTGKSKGDSYSSSNSSESKGTNSNISQSKSVSYTEGDTKSEGKTVALSYEIINKRIQETLKYVDEELLERIKFGNSKGLFKTSIFAMADNLNNHDRLKSSILSIFQGDKSTISPLSARTIDEKNDEIRVKMLSNFQNFTTSLNVNPLVPLLYSQPVNDSCVGLSTYMTVKEVSLIAGLPQKEVPGLILKEGVEFGLNTNEPICSDENGKIKLGYIVHRGQVLEHNPIHILKDNLVKHMFIAGVTGSGKTTTCQKILLESELPFLVIEPAKTEYRELLGKKGMADLVFFTLGNEKLAPFRFNPFELLEGENLTSHVDMLKATFTTAFPMEASMPQILEESIYECYKKYGWDINDDTNEFTENPWDENGFYFPTLSDLIKVMEEVVKTKKFGQELQANYIGSLVSRLSNLTVGSKGQMLNCKLSVDFNLLLDKKVIIEMDDLKSPEDKALFMGFILARMTEALKIRGKKDKSFMHITLIEEAHRLLSKVEYGDSGSKKVSVEMFTDLLAEIRKYGESLIIVDQIPNKLAVEVLKNTNTKIIHKILAKDDKDAIGDTMLMDDKQKSYLSSLETGEAVVFTESWNKPIHIRVDKATDTSSFEVNDEKIREIGEKQRSALLLCCFAEGINANLSCQQYKDTVSIYEELKSILMLLRKDDLSQVRLNGFNSLLEDTANKTGLDSEEIWKQLIWKYIIDSGLLIENIALRDKIARELIRLYVEFLSKGVIDLDEILAITKYL